MYTKWWTAAPFLLTRIYLCVNNGHNNNFNPVLIIFRYIWITFINIIHYKCIVLLVYFHPVSKWERVVALQGFKTKYQNPWSLIIVARRPPAQLKVASELSAKYARGTLYAIISVLNANFYKNINAHYKTHTFSMSLCPKNMFWWQKLFRSWHVHIQQE